MLAAIEQGITHTEALALDVEVGVLAGIALLRLLLGLFRR